MKRSTAALALFALMGCNKAERQYPTISARNPDGGNVSARGTYNHCPVAVFVATPEYASLERQITLTTTASDAEDDPLSYSWKVSSGTLATPTASTTTFMCAGPGAVTVTLTVSDTYCDTTTSGTVYCQSADAGSFGGSGGMSGAGGRGGAGGQPAGTGGQSGAAGSTSTGAGGRGGIAGTGTAGSTGVGGAGGGGGTSSGGTGGAMACVETNPAAAIAADCVTCLQANLNPVTDGCCTISDAAGKQLCQAASACMRDGGCNVMGNTNTCYCGTNVATCEVNGQPNGPCVAQITAAAGRNVMTMVTDSPNAANVVTRFGDPAYALGRASNIQGIAGTFCQIECALGL